jgi:hypothetical protein
LSDRSGAISNARLTDAARVIGPPLLFGVRLWASVCLALYVAFLLELDNAHWAGTSAAIVCEPHLGPIPRAPDDREDRMYGRFSALPDEAHPTTTALAAAGGVIGGYRDYQARSRSVRRQLDRDARLARLDEALASRPGAAALRARGSILAMSGALTQHAAYFDAGARG